jgi:hypothetical protein
VLASALVSLLILHLASDLLLCSLMQIESTSEDKRSELIDLVTNQVNIIRCHLPFFFPFW